MTNIFIVYKTFKDWKDSFPVAAFTSVIDAVKASDRLNADRTKEDIEAGLEFYTNTRGVILNE